MNVLIVEDETSAYDNLVEILHEINSTINIVANTESVSQTVNWLQTNPLPDLIFMDIHLSDNSAFAIFDKIEVETPIIFTTAYDQHAIEAFKVNSIDYLLKPIKSIDVRAALGKFERLNKSDIMQFLSRLSKVSQQPDYVNNILLSLNDKLLPINISQILFFYTTQKNTFVYLKDGNHYSYYKNMEQTMSSLNPALFYRINKQYIIHKESVKEITVWTDNRLLLTLSIDTPEKVFVPKNKVADFKLWIVNNH